MKHIPNHLSTAFRKIMKSPIMRNEVTDKAIIQFEELLNSSLPKETDQYGLFLFIKEMFHNNKNKFLRFIDNSEYNCFVLWTENKTIMNHLNLRKKVYIKWDQENKKYLVERYTECKPESTKDVEMSE